MSRRAVVHQFTAVLAGRDAVGQHTVAVERLLREMGCRTTTFAAHTRRDAGLRARHFLEHEHYPAPDLILYQMSTGSPVADYLLTRTEPLIIDYHNITPAAAFEPWERHVGAELARARRQLARMARRARSAIADSHYNAAELHSLGLRDVAVVPVIRQTPPVRSRRPKSSDAPTMLFVGRVAPNKRHEDLIGALALLQERWPAARLVLVGETSSIAYESALRNLVEHLGLRQSVKFAGSVSQRVLDSHYASASVYVSASTHEGFCVPLIEAMSARLPVVARAAAAVPETVGGAGLLVDSDGPLGLSEAVDRVLSDGSLRGALVERGRRRSEVFDPQTVRRQMREALEPLLAAA